MSSATQESRSDPVQVQGEEDVIRLIDDKEQVCNGGEDEVGSGEDDEVYVGGEDEEDFAENEDEEEGYNVEEVEDEEEQLMDVQQNIIEIAINGLEDMGMVNFKELTVDDLISYHFPDREVGFVFYSWYARMHGFAVRKCRIFKNKVGDVVQQIFVCFREGKRKEFAADGRKAKRVRKDTRCECRAHLKLPIDKGDNRWYVRSVVDTHNHQLVDDKLSSLAPPYQKMNEDDIEQMNHLRKSGISIPKIYGIFASQMGGFGNVSFSKPQMYNQTDKQRREEVIDARGVIGFLRRLKEKDTGMFWKYTTNDDGSLDKLFWCDGCSRVNYSLFGDVIAFDATYKKNKYKLPLVVFSGVNHHNQTIIFASALLSNEQEGTYVWLLEQFLDAMQGKVPVSIITDGDPAMKNAIKIVFPSAHHRLCAWHLLRNANSNVSDPKFVQLLTRCMLWDLEIVEFKEKWAEMVSECNCEDNQWVRDLYDRKKTWAAAHMRGEFFAGIRTTSRVEGLHAQVGRFVNSWNNLTDFMHNFVRYLSYQRHTELQADFASMVGDHVPQTQLRKLERSASNFYTNTIFKLVSRGLEQSLVLQVNLYKKTSTTMIYFVEKYCLTSKKWNVSLCPSTMVLKCSCMRMESHGIPCDHILAVLTFLNLVEIPQSLLLERWSKNAQDSVIDGAQSTAWDPLTLCRSHAIRENCRRLCKVACLTSGSFRESNDIVLGQARKLENLNLVAQPPEITTNNESDEERHLRNPPMPAKRRVQIGSSSRGRGRRTNHCGICGGAGHNRKTCVAHTQ